MSEEFDPTRVGRWMSAQVITVKPDMNLFDAFEIMHENRIRHLPVVDGEKLVGIVSNRDVVACALKPSPRKGHEPVQEATVKDVMTTRHIRSVDPHMSVREAAEIVCREKISALPVLVGKRLAGIVTSEDLLWAFLEGGEAG